MLAEHLDRVYRDYYMDVYRYLLGISKDHYTAEDLTQETFTRAFMHLDQSHQDKVKPWLFRVAYHAFIDKTRKDCRQMTFDVDFFQTLPDMDTPEYRLVISENKKELDFRLNRLSNEQQEAIRLYDIHGYSYRESAEMMGMKLSRYKIVLYRARQRLKQDNRNTSFQYSNVI